MLRFSHKDHRGKKITPHKDIRGITHFFLMTLAPGGQNVTSYLNSAGPSRDTAYFPFPLTAGREAATFTVRTCVIEP